MTARPSWTRDPRSLVLGVLALGAAMRLVLARSIGLGVDESYAVAVARQFSLSYFDHPPLHFWLAGAIARLSGSEADAVVRLPFVACFAGTTWLVYRLGARLFGEQAGALGALLLNVSAVFSLSTGGWVLPDGPLMLAMAASVAVIASVLFDENPSHPTARWTAAGFLAGLAMLSKYHGVFVPAGTLLFLVTSAPHRKWLARPGPWIGGLMAIACVTPVLIWNGEHHWVSIAFQGARAGGQGGLHPLAMLTNIAGQAAWVLPWIWAPLAAVLWGALRTGPRDPARWFLACLAIGPIALFTLVSLRGGVGLPHWQAPGYLMLFPVLGAAAASRIERGEALARRWLAWSTWGFLALVTVLGSHAATGWIARAVPSAFRRGDPTGDAVDWRILAVDLRTRGLLPLHAFVAAPSWIQSGKAAVALGPGVPVLCLCADPHHFYYMQNDSAFLGKNAIIVRKASDRGDVLRDFAPYFEEITPFDIVPVTRGTQVVMNLELFRARNFRKLFPTAQPR